LEEDPEFEVIIPPQNGHGFDIYRELGAYYVLLYSRFENDTNNPDFIIGNKISRIGLIENPIRFGTDSILDLDTASSVFALKLKGKGISNPEVQKYTGNIVYVDNRPSILRSINQKEDIKIVLQF
jgi:hypothetical protein